MSTLKVNKLQDLSGGTDIDNAYKSYITLYEVSA